MRMPIRHFDALTVRRLVLRVTHMALGAVIAGSLAAGSALAMTKKEMRAAYSAAIDLQEVDPAAAYQAMEALSEVGDGRATSRMGYYALKGIGTERDLERAEALYAHAASQGHDRSVLSRAKVLMMMGRGEEAAEQFSHAVALGVRGAEAEHASAHARSRLGTASNADLGWQSLQGLAKAQDDAAELALLTVAARLDRRALTDDEALVARVRDRAQDGEGRAAEALLTYLRGPGRHIQGALEMRVKLIEHSEIRPKIEVTERLYLAAERKPASFWREADRIVSEAPGSVKARGLVITAKINRNAYLWVVEPHLEDHGYRIKGRRGYLGESQIMALQDLCLSADIAAPCLTGPLRGAVVKAVAAKIFPG